MRTSRYIIKVIIMILLFLSLVSITYGGFILEEYSDTNMIAKKSNVIRTYWGVTLSNTLIPLSADISTNYARGCNTLASSTNGSSTPDKAVDGTNYTGGWDSRHGEHGAPEEQWIYIDLGSKKTFNFVKIYWESAYAKKYAVQVSDNATNWTTVFSNGNGNGGTDEAHFNSQNARYIRIYCYERANDIYGYHIYEIEVYKWWYDIAFASSTNDINAPPYKVLDSDIYSGWDSRHGEYGAPEDQWICIDLGEQKQFNYIKIYWEAAYAKNYKIQVSDDAINWTTILMAINGDGGIDEFNFTTQQKRYLRLYCYERVNDDWGYHIYEIEVYKSLYTNSGYVIGKNISPRYLSEWSSFYCYSIIPSDCNATVDFLNGSGTLLMSKNLCSGINSINISSITSSTLSIKFNLSPSSDNLYAPSITGYAVNWSSSTNYLKINTLKLTGQSSKVDKDLTSQVNTINLEWSLPANGTVSKFEIFRAENFITVENIVSGILLYINVSKIDTINSNILSYKDTTITDIEKDYYYVVCAIDKDGYRDISNNIKILSYPLTDSQGWVWLSANWLWREGEEWDNKDGGGLDYKSNASDGVCLGNSWSGWAEYKFSLDSPMSDAYVYLRYATWGVHRMNIYLDGTEIIKDFELIDTQDWNKFVFSYVNIGSISAGKHTIRFDPDDNVNFDGFYLYDGYFEPNNTLVEGKLEPPSPWKQRKIIIEYLSDLTDTQKYDAKNNPMIRNPNVVTACRYSVEGIDKVYFHRTVPVDIYFSENDIPAGVSVNRLALFYWNGRNWIKLDSNLESSEGNYILTAYVTHFSTFAVFEANDFDNSKKAWWTYNPFSPNGDNICDVTTLQFYLNKTAPVTVNIFDLQGRLIKTLIDGEQRVSGEVISAEWDGTDNYNQPVEAGIYIYQIESDGLDTNSKVINGTIVLVR